MAEDNKILNKRGLKKNVKETKKFIKKYVTEVGVEEATNVTYSQLVVLRNTNNLKPGHTYRITDYQCTTIQKNTKSVKHQFDIIVNATSTNTLNENALAINHNGDTYFNNCKLDSWELKYCLDNDNNRFEWAVDYAIYTDDEFWFKSKGTIDISGTTWYLWYNSEFEAGEGETTTGYLGTTSQYPSVNDKASVIDIDEVSVVSENYSNVTEIMSGKGVIYYMKDEWNNECPYDFKNIQFKRWAITNYTGSLDFTKDNLIYDSESNPYRYATQDEYKNFVPSSSYGFEIDETNNGFYYTFTAYDSDENEYYDMSVHKKMTDECIQALHDNGCGLNSEDECHDNKIGIYSLVYDNDDCYYHGKISLNNIVFYCKHYCHYNTEDEYWEYECAYCYGNIFGVHCRYNTFGNYLQWNTFGNSCSRNTFGNGCGGNTFGNSCQNNTFGNSCTYNTFGNSCTYNTFGNECYWNTFGNGCGGNTFGNYFQNNTFGNSCTYNTFGNSCQNNTFGNYLQWNTFGNYLQWNTFGNYLQWNTFGNYMRWCSFEDGVQYVQTNCSVGSSAYLQNMHVLNGTQGTYNSKLTITITASRNYCTFVGKNSSGILKVWSLADSIT